VGGRGEAVSEGGLQRLEAELAHAGGQPQVIQGLLAKLRAAAALPPHSKAPQPPPAQHACLNAVGSRPGGGSGGGSWGRSKGGATGGARPGGDCKVRDFVYFRGDPDGQMRRGARGGLEPCLVLSAALERKQEARRLLLSALHIESANNLVVLAGEVEAAAAGLHGAHDASEKTGGCMQAEGLRLAVRAGAVADDAATDTLLQALHLISNGSFLLRAHGAHDVASTARAARSSSSPRHASSHRLHVWREAAWLAGARDALALACPSLALKMGAFPCADFVASTLETAMLTAYYMHLVGSARGPEVGAGGEASWRVRQLLAWWSGTSSPAAPAPPPPCVQVGRLLRVLGRSMRGAADAHAACGGPDTMGVLAEAHGPAGLGLFKVLCLHLGAVPSWRPGASCRHAAGMRRPQDDVAWLGALLAACNAAGAAPPQPVPRRRRSGWLDGGAAAASQECLLAMVARLQVLSAPVPARELAHLMESMYEGLEEGRAEAVAKGLEQEDAARRVAEQRARDKKALLRQRNKAKQKAKRQPPVEPPSPPPSIEDNNGGGGHKQASAGQGRSPPPSPPPQQQPPQPPQHVAAGGRLASAGDGAEGRWRRLVQDYWQARPLGMRGREERTTPLGVARAAVAHVVTAAWQAIAAKRLAHAKWLRRVRKAQQLAAHLAGARDKAEAAHQEEQEEQEEPPAQVDEGARLGQAAQASSAAHECGVARWAARKAAGHESAVQSRRSGSFHAGDSLSAASWSSILAADDGFLPRSSCLRPAFDSPC